MNFDVDFIPFTETQELTLDEKTKYIIDRVSKNRVLVIENGLSPEEEFSLIEQTMDTIDYDKFSGIRLVSFDGGEIAKKSRFFNKSTKMKSLFTIVAPDSAVKIIKDERGILSLRINS